MNRLNRAIHDIRLARGEVANELEVDTVKGKLAIGAGERIQFHGNDRGKGIYNGSLGTVTGVADRLVTVRTDTGRDVQFDADTFREFGLGYAGTVYRGQGKTQTEVYALYDNAFAWNARTAYVGLTRHKNRVELYVSRDLAPDEVALGEQMSRKVRDEASLAWATRAEIDHERGRARDGRSGRGGEGRRGPTQGFPREETYALRRIDLTAYARDVHGFAVEQHPSGDDKKFLLVRARPDQPEDRLEVLIARDGHWTWRDTDNPRRAGDIFDLARREGAADLKAAREAVAAYYDQAMRDTERRKRAAEQKAKAEIAPDDPDRAAKQAAADDARQRDIGGAEHEDRLEAAGHEHERLQAIGREADRVQRLNQEAAQAKDTEQQQLKRVDDERPPGHETYLSEQARQVGEARMASPPERAHKPEPDRTPEPPARSAPDPHAVGIPTPAQLRYTEALARHYDPRAPIASLAQVSLVEAAAWQRDRHELDQRIAAQTDPGRREALMLRREIEHADHMALAYGRIAGLAEATGAKEADDYTKQLTGYQEQGAQARRAWAERGEDHPDLYPPLNPELDRKQAPARETPEQTSERAQEPRTLPQERIAMRQLDLPDYAAAKHGYAIDWRNDEHTRATLTKGDEELRATKGKDGAWSYDSRTSGGDRGDILDFEINRGAKTAAKAREEVRPTLERVEQERGRLDVQQERARGGPERDSPSSDDDRGPELDPTRRRGRGR